MRKLLLLAASVLVTGVFASAAVAASPHFIGDPQATVTGNSLIVSFKAAGLGNSSTADFSLTGKVGVDSRCYTKSGNKPQAANKQETINVNTGPVSFDVRNGQTTGSFPAITPLSTLTCPKGQVVVIESITYDLTLSGPGGLSFHLVYP
jgi:hypothetical protein